jgi:hypothetical protein
MFDINTPLTGMSYEEIAQVMGISPDRVRQIEASALKKLKHPKLGRPLKEIMENYNLSETDEGYHSLKSTGEFVLTSEDEWSFNDTVKVFNRTVAA